MQIAWKLQLPEHARGLSRSRQSSLPPHFVSPSCNGSGCCIGAVQCNANARIYAQDNPLWQYIFRTSARWLTFTQQFSFKTRIAKYEVAEIFRDSEKWCERISTQIRFTNSNKSIGNKFCFFFFAGIATRSELQASLIMAVWSKKFLRVTIFYCIYYYLNFASHFAIYLKSRKYGAYFNRCCLNISYLWLLQEKN